MRDITTKELGSFKTKIKNALIKSDKINDLLKDGIDEPSNKIQQFKSHVKDHLFIDDTIKDTSTYIFFDVYMTELRPQIKKISVVMYAITHRDILDNYAVEGYYGNRTDILTQMIEEVLTDEKVRREFGIGDLTLDNIEIYNSNSFYGRVLSFSVPNFR